MTSTCHQCIKGTIHAGLPVGHIKSLYGLDTYVTGNEKTPRAIIVMYSDIFGHNLPNNKLIADAYAKSGEYLVYMPDFFQGDAVGLKVADVLLPVDASQQSSLRKYSGMLACAPSFGLWMTRHGHTKTDRVCMDFMKKLRLETPLEIKIGMVGMCWGGRYAIRAGLESNKVLVGDGKLRSVVDAVVALHPSHLDIPIDVGMPAVPMSFGWGQEDIMVSIDTKTKVEAAHDAARRSGAVVPEMQHHVYSPGRHGFSVRGNPEDPAERKCLEDSVTQVLDWFQCHL